MNKNYSRYFIAIVPPNPFFDRALEIKHYFKDHYQSKASLNSPPHITLHMPFEWKDSKEDILKTSLRKFSQTLKSVEIELSNFNCFPPRVIFIQINPSIALSDLQKQLHRFCKTELGLFNADYKDLPFHPHITVAFRDLKKPAFATAWEEFKDKDFFGKFVADTIVLLKHNNNQWKVFEEFPLMALARP